ncbi:MAG: phosphatidylglycerophosphatase A [Duncaniella sp.]|nr:phosphatidylglycerophosphatase A [Duncaniella sp.]MDE5918499.1 phosphatidylglycerophosphatase A [Duncaniella sp.]MDE6170312.1 phosphatidylglycerophosphatase A [Duncaniella sp.]MDE6327480.1 phosphatidylglycerophosphatase A [Duncaniella sp.]MDE6572291.1 phosphatidylglycerophosphatase A [Duncaniella sp.]
MSDNNYKKLGVAPRFHEVISTGFYTGLLPGAPGTYAAFTALLIWYVLYLFLSPVWLTVVTLVLIVATTVAGAWTSTVMEKYWGPDPRAVVIDEYVGCWIPLLVAPAGEYTWIFALLGFGLFRVIDIFKPLGCRKIEEICPGGWGVMMDDVLAGTYALVIVLALKWVLL